MVSIDTVNNSIDALLSRLHDKASEVPSGCVGSYQKLRSLAEASQWQNEEMTWVDFFSKRLEIFGKIHTVYDVGSGKKASNDVIKEHLWWELISTLFLKALVLAQADQGKALVAKRFNVLFKALELATPEWLGPSEEGGKELHQSWKQFCDSLKAADRTTGGTVSPRTVKSQDGFKEVPLTVLYYEGPIARAYLATMRELKLKPKKIIQLVSNKDIATRKPVGRWLPGSLRLAYANHVQTSKIHYWPKNLANKHSDFVLSLKNEVAEQFEFDTATLDDAISIAPLDSYCDEVRPTLVSGLSDKNLHHLLKSESPSTLLFTGGGIVPKSMLSIEHLKYLHIHPGYLPDIRGADCTLWSTLLTGRASATCFYMAPGIDTGDIVSPHWLPQLSMNSDYLQRLDSSTIYRGIYGYIDPWIRSYVLRHVLLEYPELENLASTPQAEDQGTTFHFMHDKVKQSAYSQLFSS